MFDPKGRKSKVPLLNSSQVTHVTYPTKFEFGPAAPFPQIQLINLIAPTTPRSFKSAASQPAGLSSSLLCPSFSFQKRKPFLLLSKLLSTTLSTRLSLPDQNILSSQISDLKEMPSSFMFGNVFMHWILE